MTTKNISKRSPELSGVLFYIGKLLFTTFLSFLFLFFPLSGITANAASALQKLSSYTTYYNVEDTGRSKNISLACKHINGITVQAYGEFSFNQCVGKRKKEFGFEEAKIIQDGQFVLGVGGGVCQVSTTLYNAILLAGLSITESHPHSLYVSYVPPSRDAMVSSVSDLRFFNSKSTAVKITATAKDGALTIRIFGKDDGGRYEIISRTLQEIPPPEPIVKIGDSEKVLRAEKRGLKSESYLEKYQRGVLVWRKRLRQDFYAPIQGIYQTKGGSN